MTFCPAGLSCWVNLSREVSTAAFGLIALALLRFRVNSAWLIAAGALAGVLFC